MNGLAVGLTAWVGLIAGICLTLVARDIRKRRRQNATEQQVFGAVMEAMDEQLAEFEQHASQACALTAEPEPLIRPAVPPRAVGRAKVTVPDDGLLACFHRDWDRYKTTGRYPGEVSSC